LLVGEIPPNIGLLSNLLILELASNSLTGTIPPSLKNSSLLGNIILGDNKLTGTIPDEIGQFSNLMGLALGGNRLSGGIPETLYKYNQSYLTTLDLGINMLGKTLPSNFGETLPSLVYLALNHNNFEGHIPASLGNISGLKSLELSFNNFIGQVPSSLGRLGILNFLNLQKNKLEAKNIESWEFIGALSNCSSLQTLGLGDNKLHGAIPNSIGKLSPVLQKLRMDGNNLSGPVPTSIGNLSGLQLLDLSYNMLNGPIKAWVGKWENLTTLALAGNSFTGLIPSSVGNLTKLVNVNLAENEFEGPIPPSMGNLNMLAVLNLSYNNLQGNIPKELFHTASLLIKCSLSYNKLEGPIASEIRNLKHLNELYLSSNQITGDIPTSLGDCQDLTIIEIDHNFLTESIPATLGDLPTLKMLNLSHNNLSGLIPIELGGLQELTQLDLSYNNLEGGVPSNGVFGNASSVSLRGNSRLCGGMLDLPQCPTVTRRKESQYYLIRVLIPVFGFMSVVLLVYFLLTEKMARPNQSVPPFSEHLKVSYDDLAQATQNFSESNLIGRGGYGSVYRGKLVQGKLEVAVKVLDLDMHGAEKSFLSECEALRNIKHRNLVPILTACSALDMEGSLFKALIYEFMPNGNLDTWLHHKADGKSKKHLDITQRTNIIVNIADALDYLHNDSGSRSIIHCDVKPSNILLDDDMTAHLGDFGIASIYHGSATTGDSSTVSFGVKGTIGYIGPEYAGGGNPSTCGDVYSFGIVILEMLTNKRPTDPMFEDGLNIVSFVERSFPDQILQVTDAVLLEENKPYTVSNKVAESEFHQCLCLLVEVALSCTRQHPSERISMRQAAARLRAIKAPYVK
jgi:Leucine-rich repeat (LRR) protein